MNILILGATGYLGGNIAKKLAGEGHHLYCVIRNVGKIDNLRGIEGIEFISNDINQIEMTLKQKSIDWIINGVCTYKSNDSLYADMIESNIIFPLSVLNLAIKCGVKNYMTMGTGLPDDFNVYSFTKNKLSDFGRFLSENDGINFLDLKLEMFYGGNNEPDLRFIKSTKTKLLSNEKVLLTEGTQKRDIVRIEDIVNIVSYLIRKSLITGYRILPVGTGEQHSIRDIVSFMKEEIDSKSELCFGAVENRKGGEPDTVADISWLDEIDYKPQYGFWDGLKEYMNV